jgi:hypothetical protein
MPNEKKKYTEADLGDHTGRLQNYVWTKEEISEKMKTLYRHVSHSLTHYSLTLITTSNLLTVVLGSCNNNRQGYEWYYVLTLSYIQLDNWI